MEPLYTFRTQYTLEEYKKYNEETYKNLYGQEIDWEANSLLEQVEENFNRASEQNFTTGTINAKQFAAFFGVVDGHDGLVDGSMTYENYNYTPQMSGFEDALDNYYDDFFHNQKNGFFFFGFSITYPHLVQARYVSSESIA